MGEFLITIPGEFCITDNNATLIHRWKKEAIVSMAAGFSGKQERQENDHCIQIKELHAKIGQLTVERDFLADASKRLRLFGGKKW